MTIFDGRNGQARFRLFAMGLLLTTLSGVASNTVNAQEPETRVFIFAGQSNMVGSDSKVKDIKEFPPFRGLEEPQESVRFWYCIGREDKTRSSEWTTLQPLNGIVGPELSFAREVNLRSEGPIAIIKVAAGGTHLGGDWNPDKPSGFEMYPLLMKEVRNALAKFDEAKVAYRLEGFVWHQGENDMFNQEYMDNYGENLTNFIASVRRDLETPNLNFYIGELCTKTIWGMDLRPRMYAISVGQKQVTRNDDLAIYVPTSHVGVEIGGGVGLHYHYGTLGQLEHGVNYARTYLKQIGDLPDEVRTLEVWPYEKGDTVKLFVLAGHRNMEGERAFVQFAREINGGDTILRDRADIAFKYNLGGSFRVSRGWEPLGVVDYYDTFGPELSFAATLTAGELNHKIAIAKFTHSGSQMVDWTPEGSEAKSRNLYPDFIEFIESSVAELEDRGNPVELIGIFYHVGENDMSFGPFRRSAAERLESFVTQSRIDLQFPRLKWFVSQQPPTDDDSVNSIDVVSEIEKVAAADPDLIHIKVFDLPPQERKLVLNTAGVIALGKRYAEVYSAQLQRD